MSDWEPRSRMPRDSDQLHQIQICNNELAPSRHDLHIRQGRWGYGFVPGRKPTRSSNEGRAFSSLNGLGLITMMALALHVGTVMTAY
jgi:hypothetical protein